MHYLIEKSIEDIKEKIQKIQKSIDNLRSQNYDNEAGAIRLLEDKKNELLGELKGYEDMM